MVVSVERRGRRGWMISSPASLINEILPVIVPKQCDGVFPSFFGYNSDDEIVCLVTDMFLCMEHVLGSAQT
jgi:hypothetical protein